MHAKLQRPTVVQALPLTELARIVLGIMETYQRPYDEIAAKSG